MIPTFALGTVVFHLLLLFSLSLPLSLSLCSIRTMDFSPAFLQVLQLHSSSHFPYSPAMIVSHEEQAVHAHI